MRLDQESLERSRAASRRAAFVMLARAHPWRTASLVVLSLVRGLLGAVFVVASGRLIDAARDAATRGEARWVLPLVAIAAAAMLQEGAGALQGLASTILYERFNAHVGSRVVRAAFRPTGIAHLEDPKALDLLALADAVNRYGPGEFVSGLSTKLAVRAQGLVAVGLVAAVLSPWIAVGLAVLWTLAARRLQASYYRAFPFWIDPLRRANYIRDLALRPEAAKELRVFGLADWVTDRFTGLWRQVMADLWRARRGDNTAMLGWSVVLLAAHVMAFAVAGGRGLDGILTLGEVAVAVQALFGMSSLAALEGDVWMENGAVPIPGVLAVERAVEGQRAAKSLPGAGDRPRERIRLEGVRFAYPGGRQVLDGLDLDIPAGRSLALVGANGAGKTTIAKLLARLYEPDAGSITVDGVDLREIDADSWRRRLAVIFQDFSRFELPAEANVGFGGIGRLHAPDAREALDRAAARAGALGVVEALPGGWETVLSRRYERGTDLSGGQWQRIALARAMFAVEAGARVLVLDEPTAHLDVRGEAEIFDRFLEVTHGLTTIVISHRFSTVRRADRIVVLEGGRVVEDGSHDELLAHGGRYARMFRLQAERFREDGDAAR